MNTPLIVQDGTPMVGAPVESRPAHTLVCTTCHGSGWEWVQGAWPMGAVTDECETCHGEGVLTWHERQAVTS